MRRDDLINFIFYSAFPVSPWKDRWETVLRVKKRKEKRKKKKKEKKDKIFYIFYL